MQSSLRVSVGESNRPSQRWMIRCSPMLALTKFLVGLERPHIIARRGHSKSKQKLFAVCKNEGLEHPQGRIPLTIKCSLFMQRRESYRIIIHRRLGKHTGFVLNECSPMSCTHVHHGLQLHRIIGFSRILSAHDGAACVPDAAHIGTSMQ